MPPNFFLDDSDFESLLRLTREYQMDRLTKRVETELLLRSPTIETLLLGQEFSLYNLIENSVQALSLQYFTEVKNHPKFSLITSENVVKILEENIKYNNQKYQNEMRQSNMKLENIRNIVSKISKCYGYNGLPWPMVCGCPRYSKECSFCNSALKDFITKSCDELKSFLAS